jgi:dolichol-phosphate mannosyltransferase
MIAADLQDPPELFVDMVRHWEQGHKAVFAVRAGREESFGQQLLSNSYYGLIRRFAIKGYPSGGFDFFLIDRQVVADLCRVNEKNTNLMTLIFWLGYAHVAIPYVRRARRAGRSRWTLAKKVKLFVDSFVAFSYAPVRLLSVTGLLISAAAFAYASVVVYRWSAHGADVRGWSSLAVLVAFTAGVQMIMLGVLGEYLWRVLDEVRRRPPYVIDDVRPAVPRPSAAPAPRVPSDVALPPSQGRPGPTAAPTGVRTPGELV